MAFTADAIIAAFVAATAKQARGTRHVSLGARSGGKRAYVLVWGPSADPKQVRASKLAIMRYDGEVAFGDQTVANALAAKPRPLSKTSYPKLGRFKWTLSPEETQQRFAKPGDLVNAILDAFSKGGVQW